MRNVSRSWNVQKKAQLSPLQFGIIGVLLASLLPFWRLGAVLPFPTAFRDGVTIFTSVIFEALPFVLLGVIVSALLRRYVKEKHLLKVFSRNSLLSYPLAALAGLLLPVCECGNLPVARRLMRQGMRPSQAVTFFLAAPILNPAVIISTWAAFSFLPGLVWMRFILGFCVAVSIGLVLRYFGDDSIAQDEAIACAHDHGGVQGIMHEFMEMLGALVVGASIAAVIQVFLPRALLLPLAQTPALAILVMILLALVVSLCSNVDAFFALSFAGTFPPAALLAFLVFGPMVDFRGISLMTRSFTPKTIATIALLVTQLVFLASVALHYGGIL